MTTWIDTYKPKKGEIDKELFTVKDVKKIFNIWKISYRSSSSSSFSEIEDDSDSLATYFKFNDKYHLEGKNLSYYNNYEFCFTFCGGFNQIKINDNKSRSFKPYLIIKFSEGKMLLSLKDYIQDTSQTYIGEGPIKQINLECDGNFFINLDYDRAMAPDRLLQNISFYGRNMKNLIKPEYFGLIEENDFHGAYEFEESSNKFLNPDFLKNKNMSNWGDSANNLSLELKLISYPTYSCGVVLTQWDSRVEFNFKYDSILYNETTEESKKGNKYIVFSAIREMSISTNSITIHGTEEQDLERIIIIEDGRFKILESGNTVALENYKLVGFPTIEIKLEKEISDEFTELNTILQLIQVGFKIAGGYLYKNKLFLSDKKSTPIPDSTDNFGIGFRVKCLWGWDYVKKVELRYDTDTQYCQYKVTTTNGEEDWVNINKSNGVYLVVQAPGGDGHKGYASRVDEGWILNSDYWYYYLTGSSGGSGACVYWYINLKQLECIKFETAEWPEEFASKTGDENGRKDVNGNHLWWLDEYKLYRKYYKIMKGDTLMGWVAGGGNGVSLVRNISESSAYYTLGGAGGDWGFYKEGEVLKPYMITLYSSNGYNGLSGDRGSVQEETSSEVIKSNSYPNDFNTKLTSMFFTDTYLGSANGLAETRQESFEDSLKLGVVGKAGAPSLLSFLKNDNSYETELSWGWGGYGGSIIGTTQDDPRQGGEGAIFLLETE